MPYSTLHGEAANTFEKIYNNALDEYKGDKQKAAQTAWAGLKKAGYRKSDKGEWQKSQLSEFSMTIVKAAYETRHGGAMRFRAVASDTAPDLFTESMSNELFQDFVDRIEKNIPVPEAFKSAICEDTWCGGMPYPSISHFKAGPQGSNVPGIFEKVYVDGDVLKAVGVLSDNDLGRAVFKALCEDLYAKEKSQSEHDPVRISIGFLDLKHQHVGNGMDFTFERKNLTDQCPMCMQNIGGKVYKSGVLVHLAFTRVPVNPRTEAEVERSMSDEIVTKADDAKSIIGDLADVLVDKSKAADVLTIKSDGTVERGSVTREPELEGRNQGEGKTLKMTDASLYQDCYDPNTGLFKQECIDQMMMGHQVAMRKAMQANHPSKAPGVSGAPEVGANDKPGKWLSLTKKEPDGEHPASHYLHVEDSSKPSTWHLPVKDTSGKISPRHLGAAHAALTKGFRGKKYGGPGKGKALAKLRNLYHSAGMEWPEDSASKKEKAMATPVEKGKIQGAPVPGSPEMIDIFNEDELYPEVPSKEDSVSPSGDKEMGAPAGTVTNVKAAYAGKETPEEEAAEEKKPKAKMEKALVVTAKALINQVVTLKSQGVYGDMALQALQPYMNNLGEAVRRSVTYSDGGSGDVTAAVQAAMAPLMQEIATLKAQIAAGSGQPVVSRSNVPQPRSISFNPGTATIMQQQAGGELGGLTVEKKPFAQISAIARKSTGAG
jgi:cation transport regulator ChaB